MFTDKDAEPIKVFSTFVCSSVLFLHLAHPHFHSCPIASLKCVWASMHIFFGGEMSTFKRLLRRAPSHCWEQGTSVQSKKTKQDFFFLWSLPAVWLTMWDISDHHGKVFPLQKSCGPQNTELERAISVAVPLKTNSLMTVQREHTHTRKPRYELKLTETRLNPI